MCSLTRRRFLEDSILAAAGVVYPLPARTQENESTGLAARSNNVYVVFCAPLAIPGFAQERRGHCLRVIGPDSTATTRTTGPPSRPRLVNNSRNFVLDKTVR